MRKWEILNKLKICPHSVQWNYLRNVCKWLGWGILSFSLLNRKKSCIQSAVNNFTLAKKYPLISQMGIDCIENGFSHMMRLQQIAKLSTMSSHQARFRDSPIKRQSNCLSTSRHPHSENQSTAVRHTYRASAPSVNVRAYR